MEKRLVVVTGGIGAGKSVVSRILRLRGFDVYDCDSEARKIMELSEDVRRSLVAWCGAEVYDEDGTIDRRLLGTRLFADDTLRFNVNSLVHRLVREDISLKAADSEGDLFFVETAIPVVSGLAGMADAIWHVTAPEAVRIARVSGRDGHTDHHIRSRIASQQTEWNLLPEAKTYLIENDGIASVLPRIEQLLNISLSTLVTRQS